MSQQYNERGTERPVAGSVKRAREMAQAGLRGEELPPQHRPPPVAHYASLSSSGLNPTPRRPPPLMLSASSRPGTQSPSSQGPPPGQNFSQPVPGPHWPLAGPPLSAVSQKGQSPYKAAPGRPSLPPQRPRRPSQGYSLDNDVAAQLGATAHGGNPTPQGTSEVSHQESHISTASSRYDPSSVDTIPEASAPVPGFFVPHSRPTAHLGPPPSSRRGRSPSYPDAPFVSPIPEEDPRTKSHGTYASSTAMPESWGSGSPHQSPADIEDFFDDSITEQSRDSVAEGTYDESKLVRSASLGKRAKPAIVDTRSPVLKQQDTRPLPMTLQPPEGASPLLDVSTNSSNTLPRTSKPAARHGAAVSPANVAGVGWTGPASATSLSDKANDSSKEASPADIDGPGRRLSGLRRPPRLDMDKVRAAEARGSLTSLPDLIRRATKLAAMMDKGKRPASRFENLSDFLDEKAEELSTDKEASGAPFTSP